MSRSAIVLVVALAGVLGAAGAARLLSGGPTGPVAVIEIAAPSALVDVGALDPTVDVGPDCTLSKRLQEGSTDAEVACLEARLAAAGLLVGSSPDEEFDAETDAAVRRFQAYHGLVIDGVIGPETATALGAWSGPPVMPPDPSSCPASGRAAVVDRDLQRTWLCEGGAITALMPMTSAVSQPDVGTYEVYAKDLEASSTLTGEYSTMTHFVAFTYGKYQGARIAFHSIPKYRDGSWVQPLESIGSPDLFGDSSGCIRLLPDDAELLWDRLDVGDVVEVVS